MMIQLRGGIESARHQLLAVLDQDQRPETKAVVERLVAVLDRELLRIDQLVRHADALRNTMIDIR